MRRFITIPAILLFLFTCCENEPSLQIEAGNGSQHWTIPVSERTIDNIPELSGAIFGSTQKSNIDWASKDDGESILLDESRILSVTDSIGNVVHSIRMYVPGTPYNVFYNVVIKEEGDGNFLEPMVIRYEIDQDYYPTYKSLDRSEAPFIGIIETYRLDSFDIAFSGLEKTGRAAPCGGGISVDESGGSSESGTGMGTTTGHSGGGSWSGGGVGSSSGGVVNNNQTTTITTVEVGEGDFGDFGSDGSFKRNVIGKNSPCNTSVMVAVNEEEEAPPSCTSFNFKKTSKNWQEANVTGIYFHVWLVTPQYPYTRYRYKVELNGPVLFGAPVKDRHGGETTPGLMGSVSAAALNQAMKDTAKKYGGTDVNTSVVTEYFKQRIKDNYPLWVPGGRANTNSNSSIPATTYRATLDKNFDGCE